MVEFVLWRESKEAMCKTVLVKMSYICMRMVISSSKSTITQFTNGYCLNFKRLSPRNFCLLAFSLEVLHEIDE